MLPSIFGENLFDDSLSDFFDFGRMMPQVSSELYGKHARNLMKTDVRELTARMSWTSTCRASRRMK